MVVVRCACSAGVLRIDTINSLESIRQSTRQSLKLTSTQCVSDHMDQLQRAHGQYKSLDETSKY